MLENEILSALGLSKRPEPIDISRVSSHGTSAIEEVVSLFDQLRDRLLRYVLSLGLPVQEGEEIIQEVFLLLFRHLQHGKSRSNLRGWVFSVTHTLALKQRSRKHFTYNLAELVATSEALFTDPHPNPEERMVGLEKKQHLLAVVAALPEQDQECLFLRSEGLRYREIAEVLDISLGAVSLSLGRSLARLARAVGR